MLGELVVVRWIVEGASGTAFEIAASTMLLPSDKVEKYWKADENPRFWYSPRLLLNGTDGGL